MTENRSIVNNLFIIISNWMLIINLDEKQSWGKAFVIGNIEI